MPKAQTKSATRAVTVQFVEPMYAQLVQQLSEGNEWLYEVKFDGYRCLAGEDTVGVTLWSRRGMTSLSSSPNIARACEQLPPRTLIDGEIVAIDENERKSCSPDDHPGSGISLKVSPVKQQERIGSRQCFRIETASTADQ